MKKLTKNLLAVIGIMSIGFMAYTLWDDHMQNEKRQKKKSDAERAAEFIAHRKAYAQAKRDPEAAENMKQTAPAISERQDVAGDVPESSKAVQETGAL